MDEQRPEESTKDTSGDSMDEQRSDAQQQDAGQSMSGGETPSDESGARAGEAEETGGKEGTSAEFGGKGRERLSRAREKLESVGDKTREKLGHASEMAREKFGVAGQKARERFDNAGETARKRGRHLFEVSSEGLRSLSRSSFVREIKPLTWVGIALTFLFVVFIFIQGINYRWWIMLPVGASGLYVLGRQWYKSTDKSGVNATLCLVYLILLLLLLLYRDARMSNSLLQLHKPISEVQEILK